jgi:hypothetical protein
MRTFFISIVLAIISSAILCSITAMPVSNLVFEWAKSTEKGYPDFGSNGLNTIIFIHVYVISLLVFPILYTIWNIFTLKYLKKHFELGDLKFSARKKLNLILLLSETIILVLLYLEGTYSGMETIWLRLILSVLLISHIENEIIYQIQKRKFALSTDHS